MSSWAKEPSLLGVYRAAHSGVRTIRLSPAPRDDFVRRCRWLAADGVVGESHSYGQKAMMGVLPTTYRARPPAVAAGAGSDREGGTAGIRAVIDHTVNCGTEEEVALDEGLT